MPVLSCNRSLYIDWRMVVVAGGNVLHHVKREGEFFGRGNVRENMSGGGCPDPAHKSVHIIGHNCNTQCSTEQF